MIMILHERLPLAELIPTPAIVSIESGLYSFENPSPHNSSTS